MSPTPVTEQQADLLIRCLCAELAPSNGESVLTGRSALSFHVNGFPLEPNIHLQVRSLPIEEKLIEDACMSAIKGSATAGVDEIQLLGVTSEPQGNRQLIRLGFQAPDWPTTLHLVVQCQTPNGSTGDTNAIHGVRVHSLDRIALGLITEINERSANAGTLNALTAIISTCTHLLRPEIIADIYDALLDTQQLSDRYRTAYEVHPSLRGKLHTDLGVLEEWLVSQSARAFLPQFGDSNDL